MPWVRLNTVNSVYLISCPRSSRSQAVSYTHLDVYKRQGLFYCYAIVGLKFYGLLSVNFSVSSVTTGLLNTTAVLRMQVTSS